MTITIETGVTPIPGKGERTKGPKQSKLRKAMEALEVGQSVHYATRKNPVIRNRVTRMASGVFGAQSYHVRSVEDGYRIWRVA